MKTEATPFSPTTLRSVVEKSVGLLESRCIRLNGRDASWRRLFDEEVDEIAQASSPAEFESRMNAVIARGGLSHVAFFHQSAQRAPARYAINATFCAFDTPDGPRWLFEDVHASWRVRRVAAAHELPDAEPRACGLQPDEKR